MSKQPTVFLRLEGPLQAWGTGSLEVVRATGETPSKSGILGLVCAAMGLRRAEARPALEKLNRLKLGIRVDRPGRIMTDYQTIGAKIGLMSAQRKIKITQTTGKIEPQVSRRSYLADASFLAALTGDSGAVQEIADRLADPVWPPFLGRKSCPASKAILEGTDDITDLTEALASRPWQPRIADEMHDQRMAENNRIQLQVVIETDQFESGAKRVPDVALSFSPPTFGFRFVKESSIAVNVECELQRESSRFRPYANSSSAHWRRIRPERLNRDRDLCVFCKSPAQHVHHLTYENSPEERIEELRSLCALCHDAVTLIEYSESRIIERLDPCAATWRDRIVAARERILNDSVPLRIRRRGS